MLEVNKIYCGDCLELMKEIPDKSVDCIITDPPYGINYKSPWTDNHNYIENDTMDNWVGLTKQLLPGMKKVLTDTGCCCCCCAGGGKTPVTALFTIEAIKYFYLIQTLVWRKFIGLGWRYRPAYENILILSKSKDNYNFYNETKSCSNVIEGINQKIPQAGNVYGKLNEHPTQKPIELMEHLILIHTKPNDLILDPFLGSGTTAIAAIRTGRRFIGIEISPEYCKIAQKRVDAELAQEKIPFKETKIVQEKLFNTR